MEFRGSRQVLWLTLCLWVIFTYGTYAVSQVIAGSAQFLAELPFDLPAVTLVALIAYALHPVAERTARWRPAARGAAMIGAVILAAFAQSLVNMVENRLLGVIPALDAAHLPLIRTRFSRNFLSHLYMCAATGTLFIYLIEARRTEEQRLRRARAETLAAEARAAALSLQLNPHFLFNALNAVSSLILDRQPERAEATVSRLADFLRRSLQADPSALATLGSEIETARAYLDIEQLRFEERLRVDIQCPPALADAPVPAFLLQPLVENAVKYGVARSRDPVTVRIAAKAADGRVVIDVSDDAAATGKAAPGFGIGLANIRERLANRYGGAASLSAGPTEPGFANRIELPL